MSAKQRRPGGTPTVDALANVSSTNAGSRSTAGPGNAAVAEQMASTPAQSEVAPVLAAAAAERETGISAADLAAELEALADDLFYISESDDSFAAASLETSQGQTGAATAEEVRAALGLEPEAAVAILDAHDYFWEYYTDASIHGEAEAARFQALHDRMASSLTEIRFVKTDGAEDWEKIVHLIGRHESGALVGLRATAVET